MKYDEYMKKHGIGFAHYGYEGGEASMDTLQGLLEILHEEGIECPEKVIGLTPSLITIDPEHATDDLEQILIESEYAGEDYEMPAEGKEFLKKCFQEYNDNYATHGNYYEGVTVEVPEEMKYELEVQDEA